MKRTISPKEGVEVCIYSVDDPPDGPSTCGGCAFDYGSPYKLLCRWVPDCNLVTWRLDGPLSPEAMAFLVRKRMRG